MKRFAFISYLMVVAGMLNAQDSLPSGKSRRAIEFTFDGFVNSNAISNELVKAFYRGGNLDHDLRESVADRLKAMNRMGAGTKAGFKYSIKPENPKRPEFSFSFYDRQYFEVKFSEDLYNTAFFGNQMFAGETAFLGNFRMNLLRYQQFRLGWEREGDLFHGSWGVAGSLLSGEQNLFINAPVFDLYTEAGGDFIDMNVLMDVYQTDTIRKKMFAQNGFGFSGDLYYKMPYVNGKRYGEFQISVNDLGLISWDVNSHHYHVDTALHYQGVYINDLFGLDSSYFALDLEDEMDKYSTTERKRYHTNIPCTLDVHTRTFYGDNFIFEKGASWYLNSYAKLFYYTRFHFLLGARRKSGLTFLVGYGGYGKFRSGLEFKAELGRKCTIYLGNGFLISNLAERTATGMGLNAKLLWKFN